MSQRRYARSFLRGFGRALDLRGAIGGRYSSRREWNRSDRAAMASDWSAVLRDLGNACARVKQRSGHDE
jgi:hypothetical protein